MTIDFINVTSPVRTGDVITPFSGIDQHSRYFIPYGHAGQPIVMFFIARLSAPVNEEILRCISSHVAAFSEIDAEMAVITSDSSENVAEYCKTNPLPFPLISYRTIQPLIINNIQLLEQLGVLTLRDNDQNYNYASRIIAMDYKSCTRVNLPLVDVSSVNEFIASLPKLFPQRTMREIRSQAPVLMIDNVLTPEECAFLMNVWHEKGNVDSGSMINKDGKTVGVLDYSTKIRRDHFIQDKDLIRHLDISMRRKIFPHIKKCFHYECTRREDYKIACYDPEPGGFFRRHRDNTTKATAHRKFAMSLNLNSDEYEGGELCFPEYSNDRYKPSTGSAIVFSGAMMHEAMDVIGGKRFVLLQFFYGEDQMETYENNRPLLAAADQEELPE